MDVPNAPAKANFTTREHVSAPGDRMIEERHQSPFAKLFWPLLMYFTVKMRRVGSLGSVVHVDQVHLVSWPSVVRGDLTTVVVSEYFASCLLA